jgi:GNAT superfamily N-acetyltransferase
MTAADSMRPTQAIAQRLPDVPRWVEVRDLLLWGGGELFGFEEEPELSFVVRDPATESAFVVGTPAATAVHAAVRRSARGGDVIAPEERGAWLAELLPQWTRARIILHLLRDPGRLPTTTAGEVGFLDPDTLGRISLPEELLREIESGAEHSLIAATFVDGQPVSFCYAGSVTESLWDVSIDTLPEHRRRGHAAHCAAHMIRHMQARGKQPVWAALEENPASWRLARKLGFDAVDELSLFQPADRAATPPDA